MVIQERDRVIKELEEKVAFLEAEVRPLVILIFIPFQWIFGVRVQGYCKWTGERK